jgi:NAD-dependent DNA ligase
MPTVSWHWNESNVEAVLDDSNDPSVQQRIMLYFANTLNIGFCGEGTIRKLFDQGFDSIEKLATLTEDKLVEAGWGKVSASKLADSIATSCANASLSQWAVGSCIFGRGFGMKRLEPALAFITPSLEIPFDIVEKVTSLNGWSEESALQFSERLPIFLDWLGSMNANEKTIQLVKEKVNSTISIGTKLTNQFILPTGYRPKELEEIIKKQGGVLVDTMTKKVTIVLVKDEIVSNEKTKKAAATGIRIMTDAQLRELLA